MSKVARSTLRLNWCSGVSLRQLMLIISLAVLQWQDGTFSLYGQDDAARSTSEEKRLKQIEFRCAVALNSLNDDVAIPALHELLRNRIKSSDIAKKLVRILGYKRSPRMKVLAARYVGQICPDATAEEIAEELIALMATEHDPMILSSLASSLGTLSCDSDNVSNALIKHSASIQPIVRAECYEALGHKRAREDKVVEVLRRGVFDDEMEQQRYTEALPVCVRAIDALLGHKEYQPAESIAILQPRVRSEDKTVVVHAANAIVSLSETAAQRRSLTPVLRPFLKFKASEFGPSLTDMANCELAVEALRRVGDVNRATVEDLLHLAVNVPDDADELCASVARTLSVVDPDAATSILTVLRRRLKSMPEASDDARQVLSTAIQLIENHEQGQ